MRLVMVGLDHKTADVAVREKFSFSGASRDEALVKMRSHPDVEGCVLISTCNRTELYVSHESDIPPDGVRLLCDAVGADPGIHRRYFTERRERQAVLHLMRVAGGLLSSVPGDDQIITQVRNAAESARFAETSDAVLETLFRSAITAGKKIKTQTTFAREGGSVASEAVRAIRGKMGSLKDKRALVIGNGVIGRLTAAALHGEGCEVSVTLRTHRHGSPCVPEGCATVDYDRRYESVEKSDILVSATSSPHFTIQAENLRRLCRMPSLMVDLAIPRDIEPGTEKLDGVTLLNVDDLKRIDDDVETGKQLLLAEDIINEEAKRFEVWRQNRRLLARDSGGSPDFPVFINLHDATVLIAGAGKVAARRADVLLGFGAKVRIVSPALSVEMRRIAGRDNLIWARKEYEPADLDGVTLAVAATDDRGVNRRIGRDARERGILVSVADRRNECTFYFPAIVKSECVTAGLISNHCDHGLVRRAAATIREELERIDENHTGGKQGKQAGGDSGPVDHVGHRAASS